jgi:hypothetical protein
VTTATLLKLLRRRIADTDPNADYEDSVLLEALEDGRSLLEAKMVKGMAGYAIISDPDSVSFGIVPDPTVDHAHVMVYRAAIDILDERYRLLLSTGSMGISWQSGLEQESSIQASKAFQDTLKDMQRELDGLILILNRNTSAGRMQ